MAALTTLSQIRTKIRRLTKSPSESRITNDEIDEYINTFVLYDFPAILQTDLLATVLTFYTTPGIDVYETNAIADDPLNDFKNKYIAVFDPVYVAGNQVPLTTSLAEFTANFPRVTPWKNEQVSNGTNTYVGNFSSSPVLRNSVSLSMINDLGVARVVHDNGVTDPITGLGDLEGDGNGTINYDTGAYTVVFDAIPAAGTYVQSSYYTYTAGTPILVLFHDTKFTLRPVPDKVYPVTVSVRVRPTELLADGDSPDLKEWSQYIAFGAAKKIYEDRLQMEEAESLKGPMEEQETLCLRRTILQHKNERYRNFGTGSISYSNSSYNDFWR